MEVPATERCEQLCVCGGDAQGQMIITTVLRTAVHVYTWPWVYKKKYYGSAANSVVKLNGTNRGGWLTCSQVIVFGRDSFQGGGGQRHGLMWL